MKKTFAFFLLIMLTYPLLGQDSLFVKHKPDSNHFFVIQPVPNENNYIKIKVTLICDDSKQRIRHGGVIKSDPRALKKSLALADDEGQGELVLISGEIYNIIGSAPGYAPKFKQVQKSSEFELNLKPSEEVREAMKRINKLLLDGQKLEAIQNFKAIQSEFPENQALIHFGKSKKINLE